MIAEAIVATGLPASTFGVEDSPELGMLVLEVLHQRWGQAHKDDLLARLRSQ